MSAALYGDRGYYRTPGSAARAFRTSAHVGSPWPAAMHTLAARVDDSLGHPDDFRIVDVGAGGGELLRALCELAPQQWTLHGVDLAPRPAGLPDRVRWTDRPPAATTGLMLAAELLDVVPVDVVELAADGVRQVIVDAGGNESLGGPPSAADTAWLARWWPLTAMGHRAEVGSPRDLLWQGLTARLERGVAVAVDYAVRRPPDAAGTLTGYRDGRQVSPVPDGRSDLTAHVMFDSLLGDDDLLVSQRNALAALGVTGRPPRVEGGTDRFLAELSAAGAAAELLDPAGLGGFTWLVHGTGPESRREMAELFQPVDGASRFGAAYGPSSQSSR
jgi:SAM-dependent MidA family methyltransferase